VLERLVTLHWLDYAVMLVYFLALFLIAFVIKKKQVQESHENYFLAARRVTMPVFVATLVSTWYGNLLGISQLAYKQGLVAWLTQGIFWYIVYIFFAIYVVPRIRAHKFFTIPDLMEHFYGKYTALATAVINVLMLNPALYVLSMGILCELIFGISAFQGILIGTLVPLIYTVRGGFKAVVYTDVIQFLFMFCGVALVIPFALIKHGGLKVLENVPETHFSFTGTGEWTVQVLVSWALIAFWTLVDSNFYQRTFSAQSDKTAKNGVLLAIIFWIVFDLMLNFIAIYAFAVNPNYEATRALPLFADSVLPVFFKGIFFTGLIATIMSTFDSLIFSSSMAVSKDIFQRLGGDEKHVIWINKVIIVLVVLVAFLIALQFKSLINLIYARGSIGISALLLPLMAGLFFKKKFSDRIVTLSIICGAMSALSIFVLKQLGLDFGIEAIIVGLLSSLVVLLIACFKKTNA
jgi:solute:Na+ symporter, SSS family